MSLALATPTTHQKDNDACEQPSIGTDSIFRFVPRSAGHFQAYCRTVESSTSSDKTIRRLQRSVRTNARSRFTCKYMVYRHLGVIPIVFAPTFYHEKRLEQALLLLLLLYCSPPTLCRKQLGVQVSLAHHDNRRINRGVSSLPQKVFLVGKHHALRPGFVGLQGLGMKTSHLTCTSRPRRHRRNHQRSWRKQLPLVD